jgi:hypothetical protein
MHTLERLNGWQEGQVEGGGFSWCAVKRRAGTALPFHLENEGRTSHRVSFFVGVSHIQGTKLVGAEQILSTTTLHSPQPSPSQHTHMPLAWQSTHFLPVCASPALLTSVMCKRMTGCLSCRRIAPPATEQGSCHRAC